MSIRQAVKYHNLMKARIILMNQQPVYLYQKLSTALQGQQHQHDTRHGSQQAAPGLACPHIRSSVCLG